jgi:hypothetical protein
LRVAPSWFELLAWVALGLGFASALIIVADIVVLGNWQHMAIMDLAFPLTALYMGPIAVWAYFARGRRMSRKRMHMHTAGINEDPRDSLWQVSLSDSHCGAGCVLGDIAGEWIVWATAWMIGSTAVLGPEYILDLPLAWIFGILFQYFVDRTAAGPLAHQPLVAAARHQGADADRLTSFAWLLQSPCPNSNRRSSFTSRTPWPDFDSQRPWAVAG